MISIPQSSNHIQSFRDSTTPPQGLTILHNNTILATQSSRGIIHAYTWSKDTHTAKMILPEKIRSLKVSPSGTWCAAGAESGKLFLWEVYPWVWWS
jgi:WD40 repeat protein